ARLLQRQRAPRSPDAAALLQTALVLYADNGLNPSSFTARCVASAGATPYALVSAGLAALQGSKHGGACERAEGVLRGARGPRRARRAPGGAGALAPRRFDAGIRASVVSGRRSAWCVAHEAGRRTPPALAGRSLVRGAGRSGAGTDEPAAHGRLWRRDAVSRLGTAGRRATGVARRRPRRRLDRARPRAVS